MVAPADHPRRVLHYQAALVRDHDGVTARCLELGWLCARGQRPRASSTSASTAGTRPRASSSPSSAARRYSRSRRPAAAVAWHRAKSTAARPSCGSSWGCSGPARPASCSSRPGRSAGSSPATRRAWAPHGQGVELSAGITEGLGQVHRLPQQRRRLRSATLPPVQATEPASHHRPQGLVAAGPSKRGLQQLHRPGQVSVAEQQHAQPLPQVRLRRPRRRGLECCGQVRPATADLPGGDPVVPAATRRRRTSST